ncbi:hypothetical protein IAE22_35115, partial [Bacillus sp. S34]|nr:hypothetical protein [Bacillus sp. S34]
GASLVALAIPYVLQWLVDGPLSSKDSAQIWPAGLGVLALGVLAGVFIASRRRMVMRPSTRIAADAATESVRLYLQQTLRGSTG